MRRPEQAFLEMAERNALQQHACLQGGHGMLGSLLSICKSTKPRLQRLMAHQPSGLAALQAVEDQISNFGQTPSQVFRKKHPRRSPPPSPAARPLLNGPDAMKLTTVGMPPAKRCDSSCAACFTQLHGISPQALACSRKGTVSIFSDVEFTYLCH